MEAIVDIAFQTCEQEKPLLDKAWAAPSDLEAPFSNLRAGKAPFRLLSNGYYVKWIDGFQTCEQEKPLLDSSGRIQMETNAVIFQTCEQEKPLLDAKNIMSELIRTRVSNLRAGKAPFRRV